MTYPPPQPPVTPGYTTQPPSGDWTPPKSKNRAVPWLVGTLAVLVLAVGGLGFALLRQPGGKKQPSGPAPTAAASAATFQLYGTLSLNPGQFITTDEAGACRGYEGFDDLTLGASVTITDATGAVIGVGQISGMSASDGMGGTCDLDFSVPNVPAGKGFYGIEVAHRGSVKYDEAKLKDDGRVQLTVG